MLPLDLTNYQLGSYHLEKRIGAGGMGSVYESYQATVKRKVAVKVLAGNLALTETYVERFKREVEIAARLEHPHILPVYDYGVDQGISYVVMRLMTGGSLSERLHADGRLSKAEVLRILFAIADALDYAHKENVIHRDIKPGNILFDKEGRAYLADFGIAKVLQLTSSMLTHPDAVPGTPLYMAPELWKGEKTDHKADIYAFGVLTYQLLTQELPFQSDTVYSLGYQHISEPVTPPSRLRPELSQQTDAVIDKALAKSRDQRYDTTRQFVEALKKALDAPRVTEVTGLHARTDTIQVHPFPTEITKPDSPIRSNEVLPSRRAGFVLVSIFMLVMAGLLGLLLTDQDDENSPAFAATEIVNLSPTTSLPPTQTPVVTRTPSRTSIPTITETLLPPETRVGTLAAQSATAAVDKTATANFLNPSDAPNIPATEAALLITFYYEQTAALWTQTPTPTFTRTSTPTLTRTLIPTASPTVTYTVTPTVTSTSLPGLPGGAPITSNLSWTPRMKEFGDIEMVLVPIGCFMMGSTNLNRPSDERPSHGQCFASPFWIDKYEVSNGQFATLDGQAGQPSRWVGLDRPRENISWFEAQAFCEARGGRLPTEAEWEYAVRGPDNLIYTWGNTFDEGRLVYGDNASRTAAVGSRHSGISWIGAEDLLGNVGEWVSSLRTAYPYTAITAENLANTASERIHRGNSWQDNEVEIQATFRNWAFPFHFEETIGFRCVRDYED